MDKSPLRNGRTGDSMKIIKINNVRYNQDCVERYYSDISGDPIYFTIKNVDIDRQVSCRNSVRLMEIIDQCFIGNKSFIDVDEIKLQINLGSL
jgi:hypothetical protein